MQFEILSIRIKIFTKAIGLIILRITHLITVYEKYIYERQIELFDIPLILDDRSGIVLRNYEGAVMQKG